MKIPTTMTWRHELRGFAKWWARIRRRPWAWNYVADVEVDPVGRTQDGGRSVAFDFKVVGATRKEVAS